MTDRLDKAILFSKLAHEAIGQKRKYTGEPYFNHPLRVMKLVASVLPDDEDAQIVALLHDVVEDTHISLTLIRDEFGTRVERGVFALTDTPTVEGGPNRKERKKLDRERLSKAEGWIQTVKVADMIDNTSSIAEHDPNFWKVYKEEKRLLLDVLTEADSGLKTEAERFISG
jgi:(p)ppGpp synthase/HD superfamily hydrolase